MIVNENAKPFSELQHEELVETVETVEIDPAAEKKLVRKIDLYLMPTIFVLYMFSFVDRANIGLAEVAGMGKDLSLSSRQYYLAVIMWVVGYTIAAVPSNMILSRGRPSIFIPVIMFLWGTMAALMTCVTKASHLLVLRFLLGIFEAGFSPAVLFTISTWYRKHEQSKRFFIFLSAGILSGAFGGVAAGAITSRLAGTYDISGWRWLFLVEGVTTMGVALVAHWFLLDYPSTSRCLTPGERNLAESRLLKDGVTNQRTEGGHFAALTKAFKKAMLDWRLWLIVPAYMTIIGALAVSYFYPVLVKGLGYSSTNAQYMTAPLYLVALFVALPVCWYADQHPHSRGLCLTVIMGIGCLFSTLSAAIRSYTARYVFLCLINSAIWTGNALGLSFASSALASVDTEVRAISLATMNGLAALAQLYGSALFPAGDAPEYTTGFSVFAGTFAFGGCCYLSAHFLYRRYPFAASMSLETQYRHGMETLGRE